MQAFKIGQKWVSNAEPELAMGRVIRIEDRRVSIYFDLVAEDRTYAVSQAPLSRVRFSPGDEIATQDGITISVTSVNERDGILVYHGTYSGTSTSVMETELDPNVRFSKPEDRLFTAQFDSNSSFHLRVMSRANLARHSVSPVRGLAGPRIGLIPHQLYIASEVASRFAPRVLLADEVGLGKTIEAGLILHQQLQTGRAERVLIIVPEALTFQWFVEMIRHFNLQFTILDEERCLDIVSDMSDATNKDEDEYEEEIAEGYNPFEAQQLMLCSLNLFTENEARLAEAIEADWDLIVVDEAHHLRYTPDQPSIEYSVVEHLSRVSKGLLLLTATPEQLGKAGHFARLRLLDPDRFNDFDQYQEEEAKFSSIASAATALLEGDGDKVAARETIQKLVGQEGEDDELIRALLDRHGTGRVLFRNVRSGIQGFADRLPHPAPLECPVAFGAELYPEDQIEDWIDVDPRLPWILELLNDRPDDKFLLICRTRITAVTLEQKLNSRSPIRTTLFHEGMDLIARDRAANYFADTERGAQIMLCSEIGSEGRNFQFASNLILFDLPLSPDLIEQRIGRLDRIGQRRDVQLHIPYLQGTDSETLYRLYAEGLNLFRAPNPVAQNLFLADQFPPVDIETAIETLAAENARALAEIQAGRDRLLELHSCNTEAAEDLIYEIDRSDRDPAIIDYMEASFDHYGLESEDLGHHVWHLKPTESMQRNDSVSIETAGHYYYPELPEEGIRFTYHRDTALTREDVQFLTWESPLVAQAIDAIASDFAGNSTMIAVKHPLLKTGTLLLETIAVVDCPAERALMVDKYLPPKIIRHVIAPTLNNVADRLAYEPMTEHLIQVPGDTLKQILESQLDGIKNMLAKAKALAAEDLVILKENAQTDMNRQLKEELQRLKSLQLVNNNIRDDEIEYLSNVQARLSEVIQQAGIRIDALRVIVAA
jgi:ATP-dependent helicase HepA